MPRLGRTALGLGPLIVVLLALPMTNFATLARQEATPDPDREASSITAAGLILTRVPLADEGAFELVAVSPDSGERRRHARPQPRSRQDRLRRDLPRRRRARRRRPTRHSPRCRRGSAPVAARSVRPHRRQRSLGRPERSPAVPGLPDRPRRRGGHRPHPRRRRGRRLQFRRLSRPGAGRQSPPPLVRSRSLARPHRRPGRGSSPQRGGVRRRVQPRWREGRLQPSGR